MSVEHVSDELLQRHFDGELEPAEKPVVRQHLDGCTECAGKLRSLERMQGFIRMAAQHADSAASADWEGMFARIERAAQQPEVAPIRPTQASAKAQARWFRGASAVGLFAAAAAALLMVYREPEVATPVDEESGETTVAVLDVRSEITHVDFGGNAGTVFDIDLADGSSTPVVWINDEDETDDGEDF